MLNKKTIKDIDIKNKRILVRVDFNVPLDQNLSITDPLRITAALPTIKYLIANGAKVILMSHLGRPKGKVIETLRMRPIYEYLKTNIDFPVFYASDCIGEEVRQTTDKINPSEILLLENLRFHIGEEKNDPEFVKELVKLGEIYVNDAFGTAHRAHASTEGIAHYLPSVAGFLVEKEINYLENTVKNPQRPFVAILGGKKVSDKLPVIRELMKKVDTILFGGGMVYTFFKAMNKEIGSSILDEPGINIAKEIMELAKEQNKTFVFPPDIIIADSFSENANVSVCNIDDGIPDGWQGLDIGPISIEKFEKYINTAKTILWNGPVGVFELKPFSQGSKAIAKKIAANKNLISIIGGGDTASAVKAFGLADKMSHISTGGGAALELLEGKNLPGISILEDK
ncbi:MAG: Phosphoglycerate kinase [Candidatus Heimdallarchaeota archaeon LC_3]|nr:MAG: Phosphoglycerate kinase [Candidatus Heimdallarchaeota archaeon LC_3]